MTTNTGNQTINGSSRNDDLDGGRGNDTIRGYAGNDDIEGEDGNDLLDGGDGDDELDGDDGNDMLIGGAGDDDMEGGDGDDVLDGGSGRDKMDGGDGNDTFIFRYAEHTGTPTGKESDAVRVDGEDGIDTLQLVFTRADWLRADVQADVKNLLAFIAQRTKSSGEVTGANFDFKSVDLRVEEVEKVVIVVDGLVIDARDEAVTARGDVITATEDAASVVVNLLANDSVPDLVKTVTVTQGAHGTVALTTNYANPAAPQANVVYTPNASYYQYLAVGERATDTFSYTVTDADGDVSTAMVTVTITGVNDGPLIVSGKTAAAFTEGAAVMTDTGTILFSDVDLSDTHTVSVGTARVMVSGAATNVAPAGGFGTLTAVVNENVTDQNNQGNIVWTFRADDAQVTRLAAGQTATQVYTLTLTDRAGATVTKDVTVTLTGTNDGPTVTSAISTGAAVEDGATTATGTIAFADADIADTHNVTVAARGTGYVGTLIATIADASAGDGAGTVRWNFVVDNAAIQGLAQGQVLTQSYTVTVTDTNGAKVDQVVTITVNGTNDAPVVTSSTAAAAGAVREAGNVDAGVNDVGTPSATGTLTSSDVDAGATATWSGSRAGTYGAFAIGTNGAWTYTLDNGAAATQALAEGDSRTETFTATVTDDRGATATQVVTVTVAGTNDSPVVTSEAAAAAGAVREAGNLDAGTIDAGTPSATGMLTSSDVDVGATATWSGSAAGTYGAFAIAAGGTWTYTIDNSKAATQALRKGQTVTETFSVTLTDDRGAFVTIPVVITVTGTNDVPIVGADMGATDEDAVLAGSVATNDSDVDANAVLSYALVGTVPGLTIAANGSYSFNAGVAAYQALKAGETQDVVATYAVTDENGAVATSTLSIRVTGTNDAPVITASPADTRGTVIEAGNADDGATVAGTPSVTGTLTSSDVDHEATATWSGSAAGTYGAFTIGATGVWSYALDNTRGATQALAEGETRTETFTATVTDDFGATATQLVTVTVIGTNDSPVITSTATSGVVREAGHFDAGAIDAGTPSATGVLTSSDVDAGAMATWSGAAAGTYGGFAITAGGNWTYTIDNAKAATQALREGEVVTETFTARVTDDQGAFVTVPVTITVTGTNDVPVAVADTAAGAENTVLTVDVLANDTDIDGGAAFTLVAATAPAAKGVATIVDNRLLFTPGTDFDHLKLGATETVVVAYTMRDEFGATASSTLTITVTGTNDAPVAVADLGGSSENQVLTVDVLANDTDIDDGAIFTLVSATAPAAKGVASIVGNALVFTPGTDFDHLKAGVTETVVVVYTMRDENDATSSSTLTITVTGTNDAPVAVADIAAGTENAALTIDVLANDTDIDDSSVFTLTGAVAPTGKGVASIVGNKLVFTPSTDFDHLKAGATETVVVTYMMRDENGATSSSTLTITVTGTNDAPVAAFDVATGTENQSLTVDVLANDTDVDDDAALTLTGAAVAPNSGSVQVVDNRLVFAPGTDFDHLAVGATADVVVFYSIKDGQGGVSAATLTITVTGTNDAPVAVADTNAATEDSVVTGSVATNDSDIDDGAVLSYALVGTVPGLTIAANGSYSFNAGVAAYQALKVGETQDVVATYSVTDENSASATATLTIRVTGTNDAPVVTSTAAAARGTVVEAGNSDPGAVVAGTPSVSGTLTSGDVDHDATATWSGSAAGTYGAFAITAGGAWTYTLDNTSAATQGLAEGQTRTEMFTTTVTDDQGAAATQVVTITVNGTNDSPVVTSGTAAASGAVIEAGNLDDGATVPGTAVATGTLTSSDVDAGASATWSGARNGTYGSFTIAADGQWTYTLDNTRAATQALAEGQNAVETFTATVTDDRGASATQVVSIAIAGTNDSPVVATGGTGVFDKGATLANNSLANAVSLDGLFRLYSDAQVDSAATVPHVTINGMANSSGGQTDWYSFTVLQTGRVILDVDGPNGASSNYDSWLTLYSSTGASLSVSDDAGGDPGSPNGLDSFIRATLAPGTYYVQIGRFPSAQPLPSGARYELNVSVEYPRLGSATAASVTEAGHLDSGAIVVGTASAEGALSSTDVDAGATATWSGSRNGTYGSFAIGTNGAWAYTLDNGRTATQGLAEGQSATDTFTVTVTDDKGASVATVVTITVTGTNDVPVAVVDVSSATEDTTVTGSVATNDSDVDVGAVLTYSLNAPVAGLTLNSDGSYGFDAGNVAYQSLAAGQSRAVVANYTVRDAQGAAATSSLAITVTGTNDAPVAVADTRAATEDTAVTGSVANNDSDVDSGAVLSYALDTAVAGLTLNGNGGYSFDAGNAAYQSLAAGQTQTVAAAYTVTDDRGATATATLTLTLTGTNDGPVVASAANTPVAEGGASSTLSALARASDVDAGTNLVVTDLPATLPAGVTYDAVAKSFTIDPTNAAYNTLRAGATQTVNVGYGISDGVVTVPASVSWTVTGTNDAPVATLDFIIATEDTPGTSGNVIANDTDIDSGDALSIVSVRIDPSSGIVRSASAGQVLQGQLGTLTLNADGTFTYALDNTNPFVQSLAANSGTAEQFLYTLTDASGATVEGRLTIPIAGVNDAPVVTGSVLATVAEDAAASTLNALANASDVDTGAVLTVVNVPGLLPAGVTYNAAAKTFTIDPSNAAYQSLAQGESQQVTVTYGVSDGTVTTAASVRWTVNGTNDAPVLVAGPSTSGAVSYYGAEGNSHDSVGGNNGSDVRTAYTAGHDGQAFDFTGNNYVTIVNQLPTDFTISGWIKTTSTSPVGSQFYEGAGIVYGDVPFEANDLAVSFLNNRIAFGTGSVSGGAHTVISTSAINTGAWVNFAAVRNGSTVSIYINGVLEGSLNTGYSGPLNSPSQLTIGANTIISRYFVGQIDGLAIYNYAQSAAQIAQAQALGTANLLELAGATGSTANDSAQASVVVKDVDLSDTHSVAIAAPTLVLSSGAAAPTGLSSALLNVVSTTLADTTGTGGGLVRATFAAQDALFDFLAAGQSLTVTYALTVTDGKGGTATQPVTFIVTGTNDAPVAVAATGSGAEDTTIAGQLAATDVDEGAALTYSQVGTAAGLTINANGSWSLDASNAAYQALAAGQSQVVTATYAVTDGTVTTQGSLAITVTGTNDAPVASGLLALTTAENRFATINALSGVTDVDSATVTVVNVPATLPAGVFYNAAMRLFTLNATTGYDALGAGQSSVLSFNYGLSDGVATVTRTASFTVTGVNDAPVVAGTAALPGNFTLVANRLNNGDFSASPNLAGWTISTVSSGTTSVSISSATVNRGGTVIPGDAAVAQLSYEARVLTTQAPPYSSGFGPSITSQAFTGNAGDTIRFVYALTSGGDQAIGTAYIRNAATGAIVQTIFNYQTPFTGSTGVQTVEVTLASTGNYTIDFRVGSYDATNGTLIGATMYIGTAQIIQTGISEDAPFANTNGRTLLLSQASDADAGDTLTINPFTTTSAKGAIVTFAANGTLTIDPRGHTPDLATGVTVTDTFTYQVTDGKGGTTTATASYTLVGVADIVGTASGETLTGTTGNDYIIGHGDNDTLRGNGGNDTFFFTAGSGIDTISDFSAGAAVGDVIELRGTAVTSFAELQLTAFDAADGAHIVLGSGNEIILTGVTVASLSANDFVIA